MGHLASFIGSHIGFLWRGACREPPPESVQQPAPGETVAPASAGRGGEVDARPPSVAHLDPGFPSEPVQALLEANDDLLAQIKLCYGADRQTFDTEVLPIVVRYAQYVHLIPATPDNYFAEPGGLLRLGLEAGFYALQGTDGHIFSGRATISVRKHLEPRWRRATFIAGLCGEIHLAASRLHVLDADGAVWPSYMSPLAVWLHERQAPRYFLKWRAPASDDRSCGLFALMQVVPREILQHLAEGNDVIVPYMLASIAGRPLYRLQSADHNVLDELVRRAFALVVDRDLRARADRSGRVLPGAHAERYVVDAMRRLVAGGGAWSVNTERSRLWLGADGLFLVWPNAAADISKLLEADRTPGIPTQVEALAQLLIDAGIAIPRVPHEATWTIAPPPGGAQFTALKISSPDVLLSGLTIGPSALPQRIEVKPADAGTSAEGRPAGRRGSALPKGPATQAASIDIPPPAVPTSMQPAQPVPSGGDVLPSESQKQLSLLAGHAAVSRPEEPATSKSSAHSFVQSPVQPGSHAKGGAESSMPDSMQTSAQAVTRHPAAGLPSPAQLPTPIPVAVAGSAAASASNAGDELNASKALGALNAVDVLALDAPMRLNATVRRVLTQVLASMTGDDLSIIRNNGDHTGSTRSLGQSSSKGGARANSEPRGVFVPLTAFERQGIEPAIAVRAMADLKMLAAQKGPDAWAVLHDCGAGPVNGVVLLPAFIHGLSRLQIPSTSARRAGTGNDRSDRSHS